MPKVLIADDHALVREGLKKILADAIPNVTFGEAATGAEALTLCGQSHWDVVLLDMSLPAVRGLDVLKELKSRHTKVRVLVVSMHPESAYARRALQLGAMGYLTKESAPQELVLAVRKILSGARYIGAALAEVLVGDLGRDAKRPPHETLSNREFEIMCMIAAGSKTAEVASSLSISPKTVSTHRARILEKMHMAKNSELVKYCRLYGLVGETPTA